MCPKGFTFYGAIIFKNPVQTSITICKAHPSRPRSKPFATVRLACSYFKNVQLPPFFLPMKCFDIGGNRSVSHSCQTCHHRRYLTCQPTRPMITSGATVVIGWRERSAPYSPRSSANHTQREKRQNRKHITEPITFQTGENINNHCRIASALRQPIQPNNLAN